MDDQTRQRHIAAVADAHRNLLEHLDSLTGTPAADSDAPSLLPGWTRGHVLSHIARNADSFVRVLTAAERGEVVTQYEGGNEGRNADIEAGAPRPWDEQVTDVRTTCERLDDVFAHQHRWDLSMTHASGEEVPHDTVPFRRLREVVVHHADLGDDGYTPADWPAEYVRADLRLMEMRYTSRQPMGATGLPEAALRADPLDRLCWLLGRRDLDGLAPASIF